jgi:hypothetical protein
MSTLRDNTSEWTSHARIANAAALLTALVMLSCAQKARAEFETGNVMLQRCTEPAWLMYCLGYLEGIGRYDQLTGSVACFPQGVTTGQVKDVYVKFLRNNPEDLHRSAVVLFMQSMMKAFPCPKAPPTTGSVGKH